MGQMISRGIGREINEEMCCLSPSLLTRVLPGQAPKLAHFEKYADPTP